MENFTDKELAEIKLMRKQKITKIATGLIACAVFYSLLWYFYDWKLPLLISGLFWGNAIANK